MRTICFFTALLLAAFSATAAKQPNVVMLLSDDLGYQDVGCYGGPVKTPTIDALAAAGTRFTDFCSGCAVCSPSRATLLTGRHHIRTGVYSWIHDASQKSHLLEREITLAEVLKKEGYLDLSVQKATHRTKSTGGVFGGFPNSALQNMATKVTQDPIIEHNLKLIPISGREPKPKPKPADAPPPSGVVTRLRQLKQLRDGGLITEEDYLKKKDAILGEL